MLIRAETFSLLSAYATLALQALSFYLLVVLIASWNAYRIEGVLRRIVFRAREIALLSVSGASLSSLYYSSVIGFEPCVLCWYQRIFMFSLVFILGLAVVRRDDNIIDYALLLCGVGMLISAYHSSLQFIGSSSSLPCSAEGTSCLKLYVLEFGYISIPIMCLTIFAWVMFVLIARRHFLKIGALFRH